MNEVTHRQHPVPWCSVLQNIRHRRRARPELLRLARVILSHPLWGLEVLRLAHELAQVELGVGGACCGRREIEDVLVRVVEAASAARCLLRSIPSAFGRARTKVQVRDRWRSSIDRAMYGVDEGAMHRRSPRMSTGEEREPRAREAHLDALDLHRAVHLVRRRRLAALAGSQARQNASACT